MIWTIRDNKGIICFYTADNHKFLKLNDATNHVASKYNSLQEKHDNFNTCFERNRKLKVIMDKIYPTT
jgi:hypothetical protein